MAKFRYVNTRIWIDEYISNLNVEEKLFFLYLITNSATEICGVYELPLKIMSVEIGIKIDKITKILGKFEKDDKIYYRKSWVGIKNFIKHQSVNPKVKKGIEIGLLQAPKELLDRLCIGYDSLSHSNSNSNSNTNRGLSLKEEQIMYNYENVDESGNPIKKKRIGAISKEENNFLISMGFMWKDMVAEYLKIPKEDIVLLNIYYPLRSVYDKEKWKKEDFKELFTYFLKDKIPDESKISFDLCLSQKYVAKFKLKKQLKSRPKTLSQMSDEIKL